uniref:Uncharacterized protein MANES_05G111200 n=2 Tax=Rhizophora mucronata TaxID=61149 RepID=A0A2P2K1X8_RHIMU
MSALGSLAVILSGSLCLGLLFALFRFLHNIWWTPVRVQRLMRSQGIEGPSFRLITGNAKEIRKMRKEAMSRPMTDISHKILSRIQPHVDSWTKKYGTSFLFWLGPQAQLIVSEPEMIKEILNDKDKNYPKTDVQDYVKKLIGGGLVTSEGEKWFKMRKLANFAFNGENLKKMIPAMVASVEMMLARTAFGSSYLEGKDIFDMLGKLAMLAVKNFFKIRLPGISWILRNGDDIEADKLEKGIHESILRLLKKREEKALSKGIDDYGSDFFGLLVKAYHDDDVSKRISIEDIVDECKTVYIAGQETTNVLLSWTMLLLAVHTDWQEEARNEVLRTFGQQTPSPDGISKLKIMSMIINESLRLYPPIIMLRRKVDREVRLGNLTLPSNMSVSMSILTAHQDPVTWSEDAHLFKPERFAEGVAKAVDGNPAAYFPFGLGHRMCVGFNFALIEAKITLSMILQHYSFTLSPAYVHSPTSHITLRPQHGVQVMLSALQG